MKNYKKFLFIVLAFFFGVFTTLTTTFVFAHGGDTSLIHACIKNSNGSIRIVGENEECNASTETALDWNIQGIQGPPGPTGVPGPTGIPGQGTSNGLPFMCSYCNLTPHADKFAGEDFSGAQLTVATFKDADISGVIFTGALLQNVEFTNANLTGADLSSLAEESNIGVNSPRFPNANLSNANLSNNVFGFSFGSLDFTNTNLQNTNFSNTSFTNVNFSGAQNMGTANLTGVTWSNVTYPDGTNSNNNGNTCVGHF